MSEGKEAATTAIEVVTTADDAQSVLQKFISDYVSIPDTLVKVSFTTAATGDIVFGDNDDVAEHKGIDFLGAEKGKPLMFKVYGTAGNKLMVTDG